MHFSVVSLVLLVGVVSADCTKVILQLQFFFFCFVFFLLYVGYCNYAAVFSHCLFVIYFSFAVSGKLCFMSVAFPL